MPAYLNRFCSMTSGTILMYFTKYTPIFYTFYIFVEIPDRLCVVQVDI